MNTHMHNMRIEALANPGVVVKRMVRHAPDGFAGFTKSELSVVATKRKNGDPSVTFLTWRFRGDKVPAFAMEILAHALTFPPTELG